MPSRNDSSTFWSFWHSLDLLDIDDRFDLQLSRACINDTSKLHERKIPPVVHDPLSWNIAASANLGDPDKSVFSLLYFGLFWQKQTLLLFSHVLIACFKWLFCRRQQASDAIKCSFTASLVTLGSTVEFHIYYWLWDDFNFLISNTFLHFVRLPYIS